MGWLWALWIGLALTCAVVPGSAEDTKFTVIDARCRQELIAACYKQNVSVDKGPCALALKTSGAEAALPCSEQNYPDAGGTLARCAAWFEVEKYGACVRTIDLPSVASGSSVLKEVSETNRVLRSDMRTLLNQLCRSSSPTPEKCDDTIKPVAP